MTKLESALSLTIVFVEAPQLSELHKRKAAAVKVRAGVSVRLRHRQAAK
jgi:hypothetical protein